MSLVKALFLAFQGAPKNHLEAILGEILSVTTFIIRASSGAVKIQHQKWPGHEAPGGGRVDLRFSGVQGKIQKGE